MKKLIVRPQQGKIVAGVCAALANYFGIHVVWVRLFWLFLLLPGDLPGFLPYIALWILIPSER